MRVVAEKDKYILEFSKLERLFTLKKRIILEKIRIRKVEVVEKVPFAIKVYGISIPNLIQIGYFYRNCLEFRYLVKGKKIIKIEYWGFPSILYLSLDEKIARIIEKRLPKLVRDKIPEIAKLKYKVLNEEEFYEELKRKLLEEVFEFLESDSEEEIADILEVLEEIMKFKDEEKILEIKEKKRKERGGFEKRLLGFY